MTRGKYCYEYNVIQTDADVCAKSIKAKTNVWDFWLDDKDDIDSKHDPATKSKQIEETGKPYISYQGNIYFICN